MLRPIIVLVGIAALAALGGCETGTPEWRFANHGCRALWYYNIPPQYEQRMVQRFDLQSVPDGNVSCFTSGFGSATSHAYGGTSLSGTAFTNCTQGTRLITVPYTAVEKVDLNEARRKIEIDACTIRECQRLYGNADCVPGGKPAGPVETAIKPYQFDRADYSVAPPRPLPASAAEAVTSGTISLQQYNYDGAIASFGQALLLDPANAAAFAGRGRAYAAKGQYKQAIADFDQAVEHDPKSADALAGRGDAYRRMGDVDRAIADYDAAIRLDPDAVAAFNGRGAAYTAKGEARRAIEDHDAAIRLKPADPAAYVGLGDAHRALGQLDRAMENYDQAIRLGMCVPLAFAGRARAHVAKGEVDRAIADFDEAIRLDPDDNAARRDRDAALRAKAGQR